MSSIATDVADLAREGDGLVVVRIRPLATQSLRDARANIEAAVKLSGGTRRPLLVDISRCRPLEPEVRHFYSGEALFDSFMVLGLLIDASPLGVMMGNVYLRIAKPGIPTQLFTDEGKARAWLQGHLPR